MNRPVEPNWPTSYDLMDDEGTHGERAALERAIEACKDAWRATNEHPYEEVVRQRNEFRIDMDTLSEKLSDAQQEIGRLHRALTAANDDPSADLPGTVRISPGNIAYIRNDDKGLVYVWWAPCPKDERTWMTHTDVLGWKRGTPVEGTPAAKAAER